MSPVSWRRNLALAATLFILGSVTYWQEFTHKPKQEEAEVQAKKIFDLKAHPVGTVRIVSGTKVFAFRCLDAQSHLCKPGDNSKWEVTEPTQFKADDSNVNALISALAGLTPSDLIDLSAETASKRAQLIKEYKLDAESRGKAEATKVTVTSLTGEVKNLFLGDMHPISSARFSIEARGDVALDSRVLMIPAAFLANLDHDRGYWRDKKLLAMDAYEIIGFDLNGTKGPIHGERKTGQWILTSGKETLPGDIENVDNLITTAAYLAAKQFASENKGDAAAKKALVGTKKVLTLSLHTKKEKSADTVLTFFEKPSPPPVKGAPAKNPSPVLYATVSNLDPLYEIEAASRDRMDKGLKDLRLSKLLTSMDRFSIKKMDFEGAPIGTALLTLAQKNTKWLNGEMEVDNAQVQDVLDKVSGNRILEFLSGSKIPAGEEKGLTVTFRDEAGATKRKIVFWKSDKKLYARDLKSATGAKKEALLVDTAIEAALPWNKDFFKKPGSTPAAVPSSLPGIPAVKTH